MNPERWERINQIYHGALEIEVGKRGAFLMEACGGDDALLQELDSLLASHRQADNFIEKPALLSEIEWMAEDDSAAILGKRIGNYEIVRKIAAGGMGAVYLALRADDHFRKKVALKVIKRGMDTDFILRRFRDERQILANLNHPNIAHLFDGGATDDGLPYFVMEYVEGDSVDAYCDAHELSIAKRLELFLTICSAVHYAHQNLVVHLDIKPGNILITREGTAKLLDFGVARLLDRGSYEQTVYPTGASVRLMTPNYGSPEQSRGKAITTASDTYSLGVLLYELLCGQRPYRLLGLSLEEISRVVCEEQPRRPSAMASLAEEPASEQDANTKEDLSPRHISKLRSTTPEKLRRNLSGDLDNIALKAMHKEPERRYSSVQQLAEDIQRHLDGLPVTAQADTLAYRGRKFVMRHKTVVLATAFVMLSLVAGTIATSWQAHKARMERARAERRFNDVRALANSFLFEFHAAIKDLPGATPARELVVKKALIYLDSLSQESSNDASLQRELGTAYEKVGDVQGEFFSENLGQPGAALESYKKALGIRTALAQAAPRDIENQRELAAIYGKLGNIGWITGNPKDAAENARKGLEVSQAVSAADPSNRADRKLLATSYLDYGWKQAAGNGDYPGGITSCRTAISILEDLVREDAKDNDARSRLSTAYGREGTFLENLARLPEALDAFQTAFSIREKMLAADPDSAKNRRNSASSHMNIGNVLAEMNDPHGALLHQQKALAMIEALSDEDPKNMQLRQDRAGVLGNIGPLLTITGDEEEAVRSLQSALSLLESLPAADSSVVIRFTIAKDQFRLGKAFASQAAKARNPAVSKDRWQVAKTWLEKSLPVFIDLRDRKIATGPDAEMPDQVLREISNCDKALRK
jgi:non-specific serine/threonine protein kinase/serine/threonine-protein kinase